MLTQVLEIYDSRDYEVQFNDPDFSIELTLSIPVWESMGCPGTLNIIAFSPPMESHA